MKSKNTKIKQKDLQSTISVSDIYKYLSQNLKSHQLLNNQYFVHLKKKVHQLSAKQKEKQKSKSINRLADIRSKEDHFIQLFKKDGNYLSFKNKIKESIKQQLQITSTTNFINLDSKKEGQLYWLLVDFVSYMKSHLDKRKKTVKRQSFKDKFVDLIVRRFSGSKLLEKESIQQHMIDTVTSIPQCKGCLTYLGQTLMLWLIFIFQIMLYVYQSSFKRLVQHQNSSNQMPKKDGIKIECVNLILNCLTNHKDYAPFYQGLSIVTKEDLIQSSFIKKQRKISSRKPIKGYQQSSFDIKKIMFFFKGLVNSQKQSKYVLKTKVFKFYEFLKLIYHECFQYSKRQNISFFGQQKNKIYHQIIRQINFRFQQQNEFNFYQQFMTQVLIMYAIIEALLTSLQVIQEIEVNQHNKINRQDWIKNFKHYKFPQIMSRDYVQKQDKLQKIFIFFQFGCDKEQTNLFNKKLKRPSFKQTNQKFLKQIQDVKFGYNSLQYQKKSVQVQDKVNALQAAMIFLQLYEILYVQDNMTFTKEVQRK